MKKVKPRKRGSRQPLRAPRWLPAFLVALSAVVPYINSWRNGFAYDDKVLIRDNAFVAEWDNLPRLLSPDAYYGGAKEDNYIPVTTISFFINRALSGLDPIGYHLTNSLLHLLDSVLLYLFIHAATRRRFAAFFCAMLFAAHPIHSESVTWIAGRTDPLSALFFLIALLLYVRSRDPGSTRRGHAEYAGALAAFAISLFAKEMSITLLPVILLYDLCFGERGGVRAFRRRLPGYAGFLAVTLLYLLGRLFLFNEGMTTAGYPGGSLSAALLTMSRGIVFYLRLLVFPVGLSISHVFPVSTSPGDPGVPASILLILLVLLAGVLAWRRDRTITFSIGFFFITLLPVCHFIPIPGGVVAERYLYIPSIGFFLLLGWALDQIPRSWARGGAVILPASALFLYYTGATLSRNRDWRDETLLWTRALEVDPGNGAAYLYRGHCRWEAGEYPAAIDDYTRAIAITPDDPEGYLRRGICRAMSGDGEGALGDFDRAIRLDPESAEPYYNRGNALTHAGRYPEALADYDRALEIDPEYVEALNNRGAIHARRGELDKALEDFSRAIELAPDHANAYRGRSAVYRQLGEEAPASRDAARALSLGARVAGGAGNP